MWWFKPQQDPTQKSSWHRNLNTFRSFSDAEAQKNVHFINPMGFFRGFSHGFPMDISHLHPFFGPRKTRPGPQFRTVVAGVQVQRVHLSPRRWTERAGDFTENPWDSNGIIPGLGLPSPSLPSLPSLPSPSLPTWDLMGFMVVNQQLWLICG